MEEQSGERMPKFEYGMPNGKYGSHKELVESRLPSWRSEPAGCAKIRIFL